MERQGLIFKPVEELRGRGQHDFSRGMVVLIKGEKKAQMITRFAWKRGAQVAPHTGPINSRNRQAKEKLKGTAPNPPEWYAKWVPASDITHVAVRRAG
jgi:hypothetical protein